MCCINLIFQKLWYNLLLVLLCRWENDGCLWETEEIVPNHRASPGLKRTRLPLPKWHFCAGKIHPGSARAAQAGFQVSLLSAGKSAQLDEIALIILTRSPVPYTLLLHHIVLEKKVQVGFLCELGRGWGGSDNTWNKIQMLKLHF